MSVIAERIRGVSDGVRSSFEQLNERERRLLMVMGVVLAFFVIFVPVFLISSSVGELEDENAEIRDVLRTLQRGRAKFLAEAVKRRAMEARYERTPPQLGTKVASLAKEFGIEVREFNDRPDKEVSGFVRHHLQFKLPNGVGLRPVMKLLESIANTPYPIAIEGIKIEHYQPGDSYNGIEIDVISFEQAKKDS